MSSINSRVPPSRLAAIDSPADGEVAAYQASSGQFQWVANSGGGGGSGTVTSVGLTETGSALTITGSPVTTFRPLEDVVNILKIMVITMASNTPQIIDFRMTLLICFP